MSLTNETSKNNFFAFVWHAFFLALAQNFMDVDTVIPAMIVESGGGAVHIGVMTTIMLGGSSFTQLFFAPYISNKPFKKKFLILGINLRVLSLVALGFTLFYIGYNGINFALYLIFLFITIFSVSGAFTNISYIDIFGKSVFENLRKKFFSVKQILSGVFVLISAFFAKQILTVFDYPVNYSLMFSAGGILLLIASGGFWKINEQVSSEYRISGVRNFLGILKYELSRNKKLLYYLGFINTQGIIISFLPFVMLHAKKTLDTQSSDTGFFLLFKVIGIVFVSVLVFVFSSRIKYNFLLILNVILSVITVAITMILTDLFYFRFIFILGGAVFSLYSITMNGLLLEVSGRENRALYTGFAGAGYIIPAVFPLAGGVLMNNFGFEIFSTGIITLVLFSLIFIFKIDCKK